MPAMMIPKRQMTEEEKKRQAGLVRPAMPPASPPTPGAQPAQPSSVTRTAEASAGGGLPPPVNPMAAGRGAMTAFSTAAGQAMLRDINAAPGPKSAVTASNPIPMTETRTMEQPKPLEVPGPYTVRRLEETEGQILKDGEMKPSFTHTPALYTEPTMPTDLRAGEAAVKFSPRNPMADGTGRLNTSPDFGAKVQKFARENLATNQEAMRVKGTFNPFAGIGSTAGRAKEARQDSLTAAERAHGLEMQKERSAGLRGQGADAAKEQAGGLIGAAEKNAQAQQAGETERQRIMAEQRALEEKAQQQGLTEREKARLQAIQVQIQENAKDRDAGLLKSPAYQKAQAMQTPQVVQDALAQIPGRGGKENGYAHAWVDDNGIFGREIPQVAIVGADGSVRMRPEAEVEKNPNIRYYKQDMRMYQGGVPVEQEPVAPVNPMNQQPAAGGQEFKTVEEADGSGLPKGTIVRVNGRRYQI